MTRKMAREVVDQMSWEDIKTIVKKGSAEDWREGISSWPMWTEDEEIAPLSQEEKDELLDNLLEEIYKVCVLEVIEDLYPRAEKIRWMEENGYGEDAVEAYGIMPNSNQEGWYFLGYADELLAEAA